MADSKKETKVLDIEGNEVVSEKTQVILSISLEDANLYMKILELILITDSRLIPIQKHFIDMIEKNNENPS
jgi:hypothetical protein